jgi:hypothetical protein
VADPARLTAGRRGRNCGRCEATGSSDSERERLSDGSSLRRLRPRRRLADCDAHAWQWSGSPGADRTWTRKSSDRDGAHPRLHPVLAPVIDEWHCQAGLVVAIKGKTLLTRGVRRLVHRDVINGLAVPVVHGEDRPVRGQARLDAQPVALESQSEE